MRAGDGEGQDAIPGGRSGLFSANPAGLVELNDAELMEVNGGTTPVCIIIATVVTVLMTMSSCDGSSATGPSKPAPR